MENRAIQDATLAQTREAQRSYLPKTMSFLGREPEGTLFCRKKGSLGTPSEKLIGSRAYLDPVWAAEAAEVLAHLFGDVEPLEADAAAEALRVLVEIHPAAFEAYGSRADLFCSAWNSDRELFSLPGSPLALEESVYKAWTSDPSHPLKGIRGLTRGEPAAHMEEVLRSFGLGIDSLENRAADHLAVLLEFLAFLLEHRPIEDAQRFCEDHLDWLGDLKNAAIALGAGELVPVAIDATEHLVRVIVSS